MTRKWQIVMTETFESWLNDQPQTVYDAVLSSLKLLAINGPNLGRPHVDSVYDSAHSNMKELRTKSKGRQIRSFFAFDTERRAIILCSSIKHGDKQFYKKMIALADELYQIHLSDINRG